MQYAIQDNHNITFRFLLLAGLLVLLGCIHHAEENHSFVQTVLGPISPDSMGVTLIHEHVFLDWRPADETNPSDWDNDAAFSVILPFLNEMKNVGVQTFLECTPEYLGRNPVLLKSLSEETGLNILTNTGFYGYRQNSFISGELRNLNAKQLSAIWIDEFENGIGDSGIKPGFIKISVEPDSSLSAYHRELVRAAALTHRATGLTIVSHTGIDTTAALQIEVLGEEGVSPEAFVWTHAQNGTTEGHLRLARKGVWISLDGLGWIEPVDGDSSALFKYVDMLKNLKGNDLLHRTLISHDAGWYEHGEDFEYKNHTLIFTLLQPYLLQHGFSAPDFDQLLIENPKEAYTVKNRLTNPKS